MSRWIDQYQNHAFWVEWKALKEDVEVAFIDDETVLTAVEELARLRKVVKYLDGLLGAIDPELVPVSTWVSFHQQLAPCRQEVLHFNSNRNIGHLTNANAHADNLLSYVRPWVVVEPAQALVSMKASLEAYHSTINEYSKTYRSNAKKLVAEIQSKNNYVTELYDALLLMKAEIQSYKNKLFETDGDNKSIQEHIEELIANFETEYEKVNQFYNEMLIGDEENNSIKKKVNDASKSIQEEKTKAQNDTASIAEEKVELEEFYIKVFGDAEALDEKVRTGLKQEITTRIEELDVFSREQKKKYSALLNEIESLLPGATSAGLATAFKEMKDSFNVPIRNATRMFYGSLALIITISVLAMIDRIDSTGIHFIHYENLLGFANSLGWKLPVIAATVWLAIFASKRRSEAQRLQQEYAHKESFAKSYNGFKKQIEDLGLQDKEMLKELITKAVESISDNASKTLDGKHGDKSPFHELIETVVPDLEKLKNSLNS